MYRVYFENTHTGQELKELNKYTVRDGVKYCDGICKDYRGLDDFTKSNQMPQVCKKCRNAVSMAKQQIANGQITLPQFKENPKVINGPDADIVIESTLQCITCKETKEMFQFEEYRRICRACRAIESSDRNNEGLDILIKDIETLQNTIPKLTLFVKSIPKDKLIKVISHFKVGRKSTDTKIIMVENVVNHFKQLQNPLYCTGNCGFLLQQEYSICGACVKRQNNRNETLKKNLKDDMDKFKDNLDDFMIKIERIEETDGYLYPRKKLVLIAKRLDIKYTQQDKKVDLMEKINIELVEKRKNGEFIEQVEEKKQELELNGMMVLARESDGFINATQMCKAGGKLFADWKRLDTTLALIEALKADIGNPISEKNVGTENSVSVVDIIKGGNNQGSWIHPILAVQLAQWISPKFAIQVSKWVREIAIAGSVTLQQEKTEQ